MIILDEPTVGLDPKQMTEARALIKSLANQHTVIYSTHILSEVAATCDRIVVINKGKIVAQEAINALGAAGATAKTEMVVQRLNDHVLASLRAVPGVKTVHQIENGHKRLIVESEPREEVMAQLAKVIVNEEAGLIRMSPVQLALEEYYLDLIGGRRTV